MAINEKYSFKDLSGISFFDLPASEFDGDIVGSYFYTQNLDSVPVWMNRFPSNITSNFIDCNLDNIYVPDTATMTNCCHRQFISDETGDHEWL